MNPDSLRNVQSWFQNALLSGDRAAAERHLAPSARQSAAHRLAIYQEAYRARLHECLHAILPAAASLLGLEAFASLAAAYLERHPSQSYTLHRLAEHFPAFLASTRPPRAAGVELDWADALVDLVRLELAFHEVFDGPGPEGELPLDVTLLQQALANEDATAVRLELVPGAMLLTFRFPVHAWYRELRRGSAPQVPPPGTTHLALYRRDYVVQMRTLAPAEFECLQAVIRAPSLAAAFEPDATTSTAETISPATLFAWFAAWCSAGLIAVKRADEGKLPGRDAPSLPA